MERVDELKEMIRRTLPDSADKLIGLLDKSDPDKKVVQSGSRLEVKELGDGLVNIYRSDGQLLATMHRDIWKEFLKTYGRKSNLNNKSNGKY